jgi:hypothetical protein
MEIFCCCVGNSPGNENASRPVKYWEIIADNLSKAAPQTVLNEQ